ncbi:MAG: hypothetical protein JWL74_1341, partial [Alphaproteobacteria bacterium]|nr:hypothetical protein [Alphaproteobacteria bacterium]
MARLIAFLLALLLAAPAAAQPL